MFWADDIVEEILAKKKPPFTVYDWKTPSGLAHAGHLRTFIFHHTVFRGLQLAGQPAAFYYGFDDLDPMDGFPPGLPPSWRQHMGKPLSRIPSPEPGFASLAAYFASFYLQAMEDLGIHPTVPTTTHMYESGQFNDAMAIVLDRANEIRTIYADFHAPKPDLWHPVNVICQACGKIGTTFVHDWDGHEVSYRCEPNLVKWATGCGHEGRTSPFDGRAKMPWKVEWAAKWFILDVDFEGGGKDHFTKGSSRDFAVRIVREIFESPEPVGYGHDFFLLGGKKMSSSQGGAMSAHEAAHVLPPHLMRFLVGSVPPRRQVEFNPEGETIPTIYDQFDRALGLAATQPQHPLARSVTYAWQGEELPTFALRFSKVAFLIQMPHIDLARVAQEEKGKALTKVEAEELASRAEYARRWLDRYAPSAARYTLCAELPRVELSPRQIAFVERAGHILESVPWEGEAIHGALHQLKTDLSIAPNEAFGAIYTIFFHRDSGPQAGWFLSALDRQFVVDRFRAAAIGGFHD